MEHYKTLNTLVDVWKKDKEGNEYCAHESVTLKKNFDIRFVFPEEVLKQGGKPYKTKCLIYDDIRKESSLIKMSFKKLIELKESLTIVVPMGYKR
jgi:hypothetical protein